MSPKQSLSQQLFEKAMLGLFFILALPLLIVVWPSLHVVQYFLNKSHKEFLGKFEEFLTTLEGKTFFCYTSRASSSCFIQNNVIPHLSEEIEIIFVEGRQYHTAMEQSFVYRMLEVLSKSKYPKALKICKGKVVERSFHKEFYQEGVFRNNSDKFCEAIVDFFEHR